MHVFRANHLAGVYGRGATTRLYPYHYTALSSLRSPRTLPIHSSWCLCCAYGNGLTVRHQRSTSSRIRDSSWKAKVEQHSKLVREETEAVQTAQRLCKTGHVKSVTPSNPFRIGGCSAMHDQRTNLKERSKRAAMYGQQTNMKHSAADDDDDTAAEQSGSANRGGVRESDVTGRTRFYTGKERGLLGFLGFRANKPIPINPLILAEWSSTGKNDPNLRATQRLIYALNELRGVGGNINHTQTNIQLSEEEQRIILNRYVENRWYGHIFQRFNNIPLYRVRIARNTAAMLGGVILLLNLVLFCYLYYNEMECVLMMSDEDRRDYVYMVMSMRYSDIMRVGMARVNAEDPLGALPEPARMHLVVQACREMGWHTLDWERELRVMHPLSAVEECDYEHIIYWTMMHVGKFLSFSGSYFSDQFYNLCERRDKEREREQNEVFTQKEPTALPEKKSKWERFFCF